MRNDKLVREYMKYNKILLSTLHLKSKTIDVFDGDENKTFNYKEFFTYISVYFNLLPDFIEKAIVVLESFDPTNEFLEMDSEYRDVNGKPTRFIYHIIKQNDDEFLLSIKEEKQNDNLAIDQMTKAYPKSYIDNIAKNNKLTKTPYVLIYADIDNFRNINNEFGQLIGDMILMELVSNAKNYLGNKGAISRIGGDRFLIIYDIEDDYDTVHEFLFDLMLELRRLPSCKSRGISITLTFGCARYPSDGDYELLLRKCEKALIRGKNKGRDCFIMYLEEKCGKVTLDDEISDQIVKIDNLSAKNDIYSMITNINQVLSNDKDFDESFNQALSLIGNYFYVDRVSVARLDITTGLIMKHHAWYNPKISIKYEAHCNDQVAPIWGKALGSKGYIRVDDSKALADDYPLKELFKIDHTTASMAFELIVNGKSFGLIRYDMTTGARHWQPEDFQIFLLISQLVGTYLQKNYIRDTNFKTLYLDPKYGCFNFAKLFKDAGDEILLGSVKEYTIVEFNVRNMIKFRSVLGEKKMCEIVDIIVNVLNINDCIYGKKQDGPFILFIENHNKEKIESIISKINEDLLKFTEENNIHELKLQSGAYFADTSNDRLSEAIDNANLTRVLNKTNDVLYYSEDVRQESLFKSEMILRIDEALAKNEFLLYLQPKISTTTGELVGAEALTRWMYKGEKLLFPDKFIQLFEEQGVIEKLDYQVFENVCKYQQNLISEGFTPVPISVNVSRYVSNFDVYLSTIETIRRKYDISSNLIEVEITEGMYYENSLMISDFINRLHKLGYKVSMDDFGSGYSNLVSMAKLKFDVIKFDKSFCMDLDDDNVKIMLKKLFELIKLMKMSTLCEGVETKENVEYLTKIGCDSIQGYYYSKPIPANDFKTKYFAK